MQTVFETTGTVDHLWYIPVYTEYGRVITTVHRALNTGITRSVPVRTTSSIQLYTRAGTDSTYRHSDIRV